MPAVPLIRPLGDAAVLVELGPIVDLDVNRRVRALARLVVSASAGESGWGAPIPGGCSLLVPVDPLDPGVTVASTRLATLVEELGAMAHMTAAVDEDPEILEISTRYDGPDLAAVAEMTGLAPAEIAARHAAVTYTTLFLGFVPGFGYLGPLPPELTTPRRPMPRTQVPAGSVAIAGAQTAVYPLDSPGGWWLIGRTEVPFWDPRREPPALLRPGVRVRFIVEPEPR